MIAPEFIYGFFIVAGLIAVWRLIFGFERGESQVDPQCSPSRKQPITQSHPSRKQHITQSHLPRKMRWRALERSVEELQRQKEEIPF